MLKVFVLGAMSHYKKRRSRMQIMLDGTVYDSFNNIDHEATARQKKNMENRLYLFIKLSDEPGDYEHHHNLALVSVIGNTLWMKMGPEYNGKAIGRELELVLDWSCGRMTDYHTMTHPMTAHDNKIVG